MTDASNGIYKSIVDNVELIRLHEFSLILNSNHNIDQIIQESAKAIRNILNADGCHILFARAIRNILHLETAAFDGGKPLPLGVDETEGISGETYKTEQIILVSDAKKDPRITKKIQEYFNHRSLVSAPIVVKGNTLGAIVIYSFLPNKFTQREGEFLLMMGNHLGLAVENAQLLVQLKKSAYIDPLTGAYNRGYLINELEILLKSNSNKVFSIIMIDVNNFKLINDNYGHTAGDYVLQEVVRVFKKVVRGEDIVTRFGGDEFIIILPEIQANEVERIAQRIELSVGQQTYNNEDKQFNVSISWGTSTTSCDSTCTINQIIEEADKKLYIMKNNHNKNSINHSI